MGTPIVKGLSEVHHCATYSPPRPIYGLCRVAIGNLFKSEKYVPFRLEFLNKWHVSRCLTSVFLILSQTPSLSKPK